MVKDILNSIPVLLISIVATVTGGTAISKVADDLQPSLTNDSREIQEVRVATADPTATPTLTDTPTTTPTPTDALPSTNPSIIQTSGTSGSGNSKSTVSSANTFTLATLAQHNTTGNCYVAYQKVVYDVSSHPSWQNCVHHGTTGGRDITTTFPHSTTYFNSLPKVGTLINGSTSGPGTSTGNSGNSDDDFEDDEVEDDDSREDEDHDDEDEDESEDEVEIEND